MSNATTQTVSALLWNLQHYDDRELLVTEVPHIGVDDYIYWYVDDKKGRMLSDFVKTITEKLLSAFMQDEKLRNRYLKREVMTVDDEGRVNFSVFSSTKRENSITLTSELLGLRLGVTDLGTNFVFNLRAGSEGVTHAAASEVLKQEGPWSERLKDVIIRVQNLYFHGERSSTSGEYFYKYLPVNIANDILAYIPSAKIESFTPADVFASLQSDHNPGVKLCTLLGAEVFFRLNVIPRKPESDDESKTMERRATTVSQINKEIFMRTNNISAETIVRSCANDYDTKADPSFNYAKEQSSMKKAAGLIYLGLSQWYRDGFVNLGRPLV